MGAALQVMPKGRVPIPEQSLAAIESKLVRRLVFRWREADLMQANLIRGTLSRISNAAELRRLPEIACISDARQTYDVILDAIVRHLLP